LFTDVAQQLMTGTPDHDKILEIGNTMAEALSKNRDTYLSKKRMEKARKIKKQALNPELDPAKHEPQTGNVQPRISAMAALGLVPAAAPAKTTAAELLPAAAPANATAAELLPAAAPANTTAAELLPAAAPAKTTAATLLPDAAPAKTTAAELLPATVPVTVPQPAEFLATYDYATKTAHLKIDGKIMTSTVFVQKDPKLKLGSAVLATFGDGITARVLTIWWEVIVNAGTPPSTTAKANVFRIFTKATHCCGR
jgi:hypothetical protein